MLECVNDMKHIIENKKTDMVTWREKEKAWEELSKKFNSSSKIHRDAKCLRAKYENIKKTTKKNILKKS